MNAETPMRTRGVAFLIALSSLFGSGTAFAQVPRETTIFPAEDTAIISLAMGGEGRWLAALTGQSAIHAPTVRYWDLKTGKRLDPPNSGRPAANEDDADPDARSGGDGPLTTLRMTDRSGLLVFGTDRAVKVQRFRAAPTPEVSNAGDIRVRTNSSLETQVSEDGSRVLVAADKIAIHDLPDGNAIGMIPASRRPALVCASPDFETIAVGSHQDVDLYDLPTRKVRTSLLDHRGAVERLAFSADGKILAVGSTRLDSAYREFANVKLWDHAAGKEIASLPETARTASGLFVDAVGNRVLMHTTACFDRQTGVQMIDRRDEKWVALDCKDAQGRGPNCVAANSSLTLVAAGFADGTIHLYEIRWPTKR
jgi:WD40 domain-containing protein